MAPLGPSCTTTRLGIVVPGAQLRSELHGRGAPSGQTVKKLGLDGRIDIHNSQELLGYLTRKYGGPAAPVEAGGKKRTLQAAGYHADTSGRLAEIKALGAILSYHTGWPFRAAADSDR